MAFRQKTPSEANVENSETFQASLSETSSQRRQKETLNACKEIYGDQKGKKSSALAGMWVTLVTNSETVNKKIMLSIVKSETELYQSGNDNICRSLKILSYILLLIRRCPHHFYTILEVPLIISELPFVQMGHLSAKMMRPRHISFLNVGKHVQSQNENFLLCGANFSETHVSMQKYARKLVSDIAYIEKQTYNIKGFDIKFTVDLLPSDMEWLSFIGGELNNAAYYFSPFGDVNNDNKIASDGSLGEAASCTWLPWVYNDRIKVADKVTLKKGKLESKKVSEATKRNLVLNGIREQGSRQ
jgi:hypothetical protein